MKTGLIMTMILLFLAFPFGITYSQNAISFRDQQRQFARVRTAYAEKEEQLREHFRSRGIEVLSNPIFLRIFKSEQIIEVWVNSGQIGYRLLLVYPFCSSSGTLGPKRQMGDRQIPEGFYHFDRYNPNSSFYLSLGINYPNASDRILGTQGRLGGDIFIHGSCVTIGCIPITDDSIKELYLLAVEARSAGQREIPVHIFPCRMDEQGMDRLRELAEGNNDLFLFWTNLKSGYDFFEKHRLLPVITTDNRGVFQFQ